MLSVEPKSPTPIFSFGQEHHLPLHSQDMTMTTNSSHIRTQERGLARTWPNPRASNMPPEHSARPGALLHGREKRLRGRLHEGWEAICIGTALCDFCSKQSRGVVQKCLKCGLSICSPCSQRGALRGNRNHRLDHNAVCWDRSALEPRRTSKAICPKLLKRTRRHHHLRTASLSGDPEATPTTVHGQQQQQHEQDGLAERSDGQAAYPFLALQHGHGRCPRRRLLCEKETQTPAWWVPELCPRNPFRVPAMGDAVPFRSADEQADEQDAASILAGMPLSGSLFREETTLDVVSRRGKAAAKARFVDDAAYHHHGGPQVLYDEGMQGMNAETECQCGEIGHQDFLDEWV
ncbi:hypothetical protein E4U43_008091 [Claviceps pusilla]|uniref:Uncharacterized protein n=1 Tax=Claviceps pusilla TaxID=123648 RepID=A0A9P7SZX9_9HYPO|nr:hypothetical protein E4U43_008091 [Claviceps pusilla]